MSKDGHRIKGRILQAVSRLQSQRKPRAMSSDVPRKIITEWTPSSEEHRLQLVDDRVELYYLQSVLTDEECDHIIKLAEGHFSRSTVLDHQKLQSVVDEIRTSSTYFIPKSCDRIIKKIEKRMAAVLGVPESHLEPFQVVKYEPGQYFNEHYDWFSPQQVERQGSQRQYTIFAYLNTADGNTEFPKLELSFKPKKGDAVKWTNCRSLSHRDELTLHRGAPPKEGVKYGLNVWSCFRPYK